MQHTLLETLSARLRDAGLGTYETLLLPHARLAFGLHLNGESSGELGESRWGGTPDVPVAFEWPRDGLGIPLAFMAQINLEDLTPDEENPFPDIGLLLLFVSFEEETPHIILVPTGVELQHAELPTPHYAEYYGELAPHRLRIEAHADLPQWATSDYSALTENMSEEEQNIYGDLFNVTEGVKGDFVGQLLGHVAGIGADPRESACVEVEGGDTSDLRGAKNWRNLVTFDSVGSLNFLIGDAGYLVLMIHEDDLPSLNFARVYAQIQSS